MTDRDIIERLRSHEDYDGSQFEDVCKEAAETIERLQRERDYLKLQASTHAQEARCANHTIGEIYQVVTGKTGEPGSWNGAIPVREAFERLTAREQKLVKALGRCRELFTDIRNDWSDPRPECREGWDIIDAALSDGGGK